MFSSTASTIFCWMQSGAMDLKAHGVMNARSTREVALDPANGERRMVDARVDASASHYTRSNSIESNHLELAI